MSNPVQAALGAKRKKGFWIAGCTALFLSCASYGSRAIVLYFNTHLFGAETQNWGWCLYVALRLPFAALFVWTVMRFPGHGNRVAHENKPAVKTRLFDPLMGLRALACFIVLIGHYFGVTSAFSGNENRYVRVLLLAPPWCGVWIFFTLSGYLMGKGFTRGRYTLDEAGARSFFRNRLLRIGPIYFCAILLVSLYRYTDIFQWKHWWMLIEMFIFDYQGNLPINPIGALWSVSTEVQFYVLVPLLMVILLHLRRWAGPAFAIAPLLLVSVGTAFRIWISRHPAMDPYSYIYAPLIPNLDLFLAGMSVNLIPPVSLPIALRKQLGPIFLACAVCFYLTISAVSLERNQFHFGNFVAKGPLLCVPFAAAFIYLAEIRGSIEIRPGWIGRFLLAVQTIGTLTYCLYVFHPEVFIVNAELLPRIHSLSVSLAHFPIVMLELSAVAAFFYFAVEKPFDLRKRVAGTTLEDAP
jgi:peptidoglycan/LPS O-acetylase OafA/YrhL